MFKNKNVYQIHWTNVEIFITPGLTIYIFKKIYIFVNVNV